MDDETDYDDEFIKAWIGGIPIIQQLHDDMVAAGFTYLEIVAGVASGRTWHKHGYIIYDNSNQPFPDEMPPHLRLDWLEDWFTKHKPD